MKTIFLLAMLSVSSLAGFWLYGREKAEMQGRAEAAAFHEALAEAQETPEIRVQAVKESMAFHQEMLASLEGVRATQQATQRAATDQEIAKVQAKLRELEKELLTCGK